MTASHLTVQTPITGNEDLGDLSQPLQALAQFYRAFNTGDLELMAQNWASQDENIVMSNPVGGVRRGWPEIRGVYAKIFTGGATVKVEFWDYTLHVTDDVFWAIGRERGTSQRDGRSLEIAIRTTRLFRRIEGRWRQVHHHGSFEDAQLLEAYQRAVGYKAAA
jgi:ketosteroid isomerase-like protein